MDQSEILISYKSSFLPLFVDPEFALQAKSQNKLYNESPKEGGSVNFLSKHLLGPLRLALRRGQFCISWYPNKGEASRRRGGAQVHMQRKDCAPSHILHSGLSGWSCGQVICQTIWTQKMGPPLDQCGEKAAALPSSTLHKQDSNINHLYTKEKC